MQLRYLFSSCTVFFCLSMSLFSQADVTPPVISNITPASTVNNCSALSRPVTCQATDVNGIASVVLQYTVGGIAQTPLPMSFGGGIYSATIPAQGSNAVDYRIVATDASNNSNVATTGWYWYQDLQNQLTGVPDDTLCGGGSTTLSVYTKNSKMMRFTEITLNRTGTGATNPYPTWATGNDLIEIMNTGNMPLDFSNHFLEVVGVGARTYTFPPNLIIPAGGIVVVHLGTGVDSPANRYYNTGGTNDALIATSASGFILRKNANGKILDAVATNSYVFPASTGVTNADWSGNINTTAARAGIILNTTDNNQAANWTNANTSPVQTIGAQNPNVSIQNTYVFSWSPGGMTTPSITVSPVTTTTYTANLSDGFCNVNDPVTVYAGSQPAAPTTTGGISCGTLAAQLSASGSPTLRWYDAAANGNLVNTGTTFSVLTSNTVTYYVESSNGPCQSSRTPVTATAQVPAVINAIAAPATICQLQSTTLTASSSNTNYVYTWTGSGLQSSSGSSVTAVPTGTGNYIVTGSDNICATSDTVSVTVNPAPIHTLNGFTGTSCPGVSVNITLNEVNPGPPVTYNWTSVPSGFTANTAGISVFPTQNTIYTCLVSYSNGCSLTYSDTVTIYTPVVASCNNVAGCAGTNAQITGIGTGGKAPIQHTWSQGNPGNPLNITLTNSTTVIYTATDACGQTDTASSVVTVYPNPVVSFGSDVTNCGPLVLNAAGPGITGFDWSNNSTDSAITVTGSGIYFVDVTTANGCHGYDTIIVVINTVPQVAFIFSPTALCPTDNLVQLSGGQPANGQYSGPGVTGNQFNPGIGAGTHTIYYSYTAGNGCTGSDSVDILVSPCLGVETENPVSISVFPNPVTDYFTVQLAGFSEAGTLRLVVTDIQGRILETRQLAAGMESVLLSAENWLPGMYQVQLETPERKVHVKIIRE